MIYIFLAFATLLSAQISSVPTSSSGGGTIYTGDGSKITVTGTVISTTSELCGRSEACTVLAARDMSGAGQMIIPRGSGAPPSTGCDAAGEVGNQYINSTASGSTSGHYVCTASGGTPAWVQLPRSGGGGTFATTDAGWWLTAPPAGAGSVTQTTTFTQFQPRYMPYRALANETIRQISGWGNAAPSGNIRIGIYDSGCNLLGQSATVALAAGATTATFSPAVSLTPGYYYIAVVSDATSGNSMGAVSGSTVDGIIMNAGVSTPQLFTGPTGASITLPATCGTRTALTGFANYTVSMWARP